MDRLVTIRSSRYGMDIQLDPDVPFLELTEALNRKFSDSSKFFKGARMAVSFSGRTLSRTEEARILKIISDTTDIEVVCIIEPGARVAAKGNIVIVGALYGSVHAGASGDRNAFIVALSMQPKQLMIADIEAKRQIIYQESLNISGPKIAVIDGKRIYLDPLVD